MNWTPHVTVAAIVEKDGRFLLVEEVVEGRRCVNQPAGHWERGETLLDAVVRETLEETGYTFRPQALLGVYHWDVPGKDLSYLRFAFIGEVGERDRQRPPDAGIIGPVWMALAEMETAGERLRSPQVLRGVRDYLAGQRHPLEVIGQV